MKYFTPHQSVWVKSAVTPEGAWVNGIYIKRGDKNLTFPHYVNIPVSGHPVTFGFSDSAVLSEEEYAAVLLSV